MVVLAAKNPPPCQSKPKAQNKAILSIIAHMTEKVKYLHSLLLKTGNYAKISAMNDQVTPAETAELLSLAEKCLHIPGDFVELGCYRGDTSVLLGELLQKSSDPKCLWLYDSFAGLPDKTVEDSSGAGANFQAGELFVTKRAVVDKLKKHGLKIANPANPSTIIVKKAWFDELTPADLPSKIAFAFLDGDLYSSIKTSLGLVAPRLASQGIMVVHDYNNPELPGSARAVDEWLRAHADFTLNMYRSLAILRRVC